MWPLVALALLKVALHLLLAERYGYSAAELYVLACSERLDWGYLDQPPLIAYLALAARIVGGSALVAIRIGPALAGGALVLVTGLLAGRLGAGRFAQLLAGLCVAFSPAFLAAHGVLGAAAYAPLLWTLFAYVLVGRESGATGSSATVVGLLVGAGILAAPEMAVYAAGVPVALVLVGDAPRRRSWLSAVVVVLMLAPACMWQVRHDWPIVTALTSGAPGDPLAQFLAMVAALQVATAPLWIGGALALLLAPRLGDARALGIGLIPVVAAAVHWNWEPRALLPLTPVLFVAGAMLVEALSRGRALVWLRPASVAAVLVAGVVSAPLVLPILAPESVPAYASRAAVFVRWPVSAPAPAGLPEPLAQMFGWEQRVAAARRAFDTVDRDERVHTVVWARSRWDAAAVDRLGERYRLPRAISGDGNYRLWGPGDRAGSTVIVIGFRPEELQPWFRTVRTTEVVACKHCPAASRRVAVHVCEGPRHAMSDFWAKAIVAGP